MYKSDGRLVEIWLDTTNREKVAEASALGFLHGVTTNPKLIAQADIPLEEIIPTLLALQSGPLAVQVLAENTDGMVMQGQKLYAFSPRIIVKIPATLEGYKAMHSLSRMNISVMATAVFEPLQALLAWKAGAKHAALYLGRIAERGKDPLAFLQLLKKLKIDKGYEGKILAAGLRSLELVYACVETGICAITIPDAVWKNILQGSEDTQKSVYEFSSIWQISKNRSINDRFLS